MLLLRERRYRPAPRNPSKRPRFDGRDVSTASSADWILAIMAQVPVVLAGASISFPLGYRQTVQKLLSRTLPSLAASGTRGSTSRWSRHIEPFAWQAGPCSAA